MSGTMMGTIGIMGEEVDEHESCGFSFYFSF
jgi:hypothetical protein